MAKKSSSSATTSRFRKKAKVSRPGVHSKKRTSKLKSSRNYKKKYRGQG
jgi:hypothetical protein